MKAALFALGILCSAAESLVAGPFEDGLNALEAGKYGAAMRLLRAKAQYRIGVIYEEGRGVPVNYTEALGWLLQAADQGNAEAQNRIGFLYFYGRGVSKNYVSAHMWFDLAAFQGYQFYPGSSPPYS
jgi:uncharacterized protein